MMPTTDISLQTSEVTGIKIANGEMHVHNEKVITVSPREGFMGFLYFLKSIKKPCILLAYNGSRFDVPRIINLATTLGLLKELRLFVKGFCDSLLLFKSILPERQKEKKSFSQNALVTDYLEKGDIMIAHNALNDVMMLNRLIRKLCKETSVVITFSQSVDYILNFRKRLIENKKCKESLLDIHISKSMINKISKTGINRSILEKACESGELDGLHILLGENVSGKPRVTNNKKIIESIFNQLSKR